MLAFLNILDIFLLPLNRNTGRPWKTESNINFLKEISTNCSNKEDEQLKKCFETIAYSNEETVLKTNHRGYNQTYFSLGLYQVETIEILGQIPNIPQVYSPEPGSISFSFEDTLKFTLNPTLLYWVFFQDWRYNMVTFNPKTIPGLMYLKQDNGSYSFYLEVHRSNKYWVEG